MKQILKCPDCKTEFEFDPSDDAKVLTDLSEVHIHRLLQEKEVVAYLTCPKGHTQPYKIKKKY